MKQGNDMASLLAGLVVEHAVKSHLLFVKSWAEVNALVYPCC